MTAASLPQPPPRGSATKPDEQTADAPPLASWPRTRLASAACTTSVALALASPLMLGAADRSRLVLSAVPVLLAAFVVRWSFDSRTLTARGRLGLRVVAATLPAAMLGVAVVTAVHAILGMAVAPLAVLLSLALTVAAVCAAAAARAVELRLRRASRKVFLIASEEQRHDLQRQALRHGDMQVVGFARSAEILAGRYSPAGLVEAIVEAGATSLVLSAESARDERVCAAASLCNLQGQRVRTLERFYEEQFKRVSLSELTPSWFLFDIAEIHRPRLYARSKRAAELLAAAIGLLVTAPLMAAVAIAVRLSGPGPALFRQQRVGLAGEPFTMLKFRTMSMGDPSAQASWAAGEQARITPLGRRLRRYRIDELPQLWNVLRGQLSLIGPRPEQVALVERLERQIPFYGARHVVRPGLTGWAQVNCGYGGSLEGTLEKLQFDLYYVKHQSLRLDLLILASTSRAVVGARDT